MKPGLLPNHQPPEPHRQKEQCFLPRLELLLPRSTNRPRQRVMLTKMPSLLPCLYPPPIFFISIVRSRLSL